MTRHKLVYVEKTKDMHMISMINKVDEEALVASIELRLTIKEHKKSL